MQREQSIQLHPFLLFILFHQYIFNHHNHTSDSCQTESIAETDRAAAHVLCIRPQVILCTKKFKNPIDKTKVRYYINERKVLALKAIEC
jgi:hypothetical protein